jgi:hypothetical protein
VSIHPLKYLIPIFAAVLSTGTLWSCAGTQALKRKMGPQYEAETQSWLDLLDQSGRSGMWLVTRGYHTGDDIVAIATDSPLSHASILDFERSVVIEAVAEGVIETDLRQFLRETHRLVLIRPAQWTLDGGLTAVEKARNEIGKKYDYLGVVGLPKRDNWYCSELAAWSIGVSVHRKGPNHVLHPRNMHLLGDVLFDTGPRDGEPEDIPLDGKPSPP